MDLDNTLCRTENSDYIHAIPIYQRIERVNELKQQGNMITIWTARGQTSGNDHSELTKQQLKEWGVQYDKLLINKPSYDMYIDDKSFHVDSIWPIPNDSVSKKQQAEIVPKGWGKEIIFVNNDEYCGKILCFHKNKQFSMHYHLQKKETWYVSKGLFSHIWISPNDGIKHTEILHMGDIITNERGEAHQLLALEEDSQIFEVSTKHYDNDSYRVWKGD